MAASTLAKHYNLLDGGERFAMLIEAMARSDDQERERLDDSCPRGFYEIDDPAYRMRIDIAFTATALACASIQRDLDVLRTIAATHDVLNLFRPHIKQRAEQAYFMGWYARGKNAGKYKGPPLKDGDLDTLGELALVPLDIAQRSIHQALGQVRAVSLLSAWEGLSRFSREHCGVEPVTLTKALRLLEGDPAVETRQMYPEAHANAAEAGHWYESLAAAWRKHIEDSGF